MRSRQAETRQRRSRHGYMMETNGGGHTDEESTSRISPFHSGSPCVWRAHVQPWHISTLQNSTASPKYFRIMTCCEEPFWLDPTHFSGLVSCHFAIALFTLITGPSSNPKSLKHQAIFITASLCPISPAADAWPAPAFPLRLNITVASLREPFRPPSLSGLSLGHSLLYYNGVGQTQT